MPSSLRRRASLGTAAAALGIGFTALAAQPAAAQVTTIYDNTTTQTGFFVPNGGASAANPTTTIIADDITAASGFDGQEVTGFTFSVYNAGLVDTTFSPTAYFYAPDPTTGLPSTLLSSVPLDPITETANGANFFTVTDSAGFFALPTTDPGSGVTFWAGLSFSGAPSDQLNNLGQLTFDPPAVGSSQDLFFASSGPATTADNPAGGLFFFNSNPVANLGWSFQVGAPAVPEASTTVSLGLLLALGMGGLIVASKRKKASAEA